MVAYDNNSTFFIKLPKIFENELPVFIKDRTRLFLPRIVELLGEILFHMLLLQQRLLIIRRVLVYPRRSQEIRRTRLRASENISSFLTVRLIAVRSFTGFVEKQRIATIYSTVFPPALSIHAHVYTWMCNFSNKTSSNLSGFCSVRTTTMTTIFSRFILPTKYFFPF